MFAVTTLLLTAGHSLADTTFLLDIRGTGGIVSTAADFAVQDANVDLTEAVNVLTASNTSATANGITVGIGTGGIGDFHDPGDPFDDVAILDGYQFTFGVANRDIDISGLSSLTLGDFVTITLYGAGDSITESGVGRTSFVEESSGVELGQTSLSVPFVQHTFVADGSDTFNIDWGRIGTSGGAGFNGLSITAVSAIPEPSTSILGLVAGLGFLVRRRK